MKNTLKSDKEQICAALDIAHQKVLDEQDVYRERLDAIIELSESEVWEKLQRLGEVGIAEVMKDERSPACSQDRQKYLEQSWEEIPSRLQIEQIEDKDVQIQTYFLNEVAEHRDRIKAVTVFCEAIRPSKGDLIANMIFHFWEDQYIFTQLAEEQKGINEEKSILMMKKSENMKRCIEVCTGNYDNENEWHDIDMDPNNSRHE